MLCNLQYAHCHRGLGQLSSPQGTPWAYYLRSVIIIFFILHNLIYLKYVCHYNLNLLHSMYNLGITQFDVRKVDYFTLAMNSMHLFHNSQT